MAGTVNGTVASVNDKGVRLLGFDNWHNFSKFAADLVPPVLGDRVSLTLDRAGFVRSVEPASGTPPRIAGASDVPAAPAAPSVKDRTITRLAVLKAASEFAAARPQLKSGEVLKIAASWERWVLRDDEDLAELPD